MIIYRILPNSFCLDSLTEPCTILTTQLKAETSNTPIMFKVSASDFLSSAEITMFHVETDFHFLIYRLR